MRKMEHVKDLSSFGQALFALGDIGQPYYGNGVRRESRKPRGLSASKARAKKRHKRKISKQSRRRNR